MHFLLSFLTICAFFVLIIAGLISVLRDMLMREWPVAPAAGTLNLDLSRDLDHPLRRQVEPVDDFGGIAVEKSE
jgi:hypothetical protein